MSIERIKQLNYLLNEAKGDDPEFEAFRKKLENIFKDTAKYFQSAARDLGRGQPEITDAILADMKDYNRLARLAKAGSREQIYKAWSSLDTAPMEMVLDIIEDNYDKDTMKQFMSFMKK